MCARGVVALIHGELVAQGGDFELQGGSRLEAGAERGDGGEEDAFMRSASYPTSVAPGASRWPAPMSRETPVMAVVR